jgi:hypothetical protein
MTVENPKLIITGGCSASTTTPNSRNINWPMHIHDRVKTNLINTAVGGSGNISISRRIVFQVTNALKIFKPEELLVGIMQLLTLISVNILSPISHGIILLVQQTVWNIIPCTILNHQKQVYYGINIFNMI